MSEAKKDFQSAKSKPSPYPGSGIGLLVGLFAGAAGGYPMYLIGYEPNATATLLAGAILACAVLEYVARQAANQVVPKPFFVGCAVGAGFAVVSPLLA